AACLRPPRGRLRSPRRPGQTRRDAEPPTIGRPDALKKRSDLGVVLPVPRLERVAVGPVGVDPAVLLAVLLHPVELRGAEALHPAAQVHGEPEPVVAPPWHSCETRPPVIDRLLRGQAAVAVRDTDRRAEMLAVRLVQTDERDRRVGA